jgi:hypothetical protein
MLRLLRPNGADEDGADAREDPPPRPTPGRPAPKPPSSNPKVRKARRIPSPRRPRIGRGQAEEDRIVALLKEKPMRIAELVRAAGTPKATEQGRLNRLEAKGPVMRADGAWTAPP